MVLGRFGLLVGCSTVAFLLPSSTGLQLVRFNAVLRSSRPFRSPRVGLYSQDGARFDTRSVSRTNSVQRYATCKDVSSASRAFTMATSSSPHQRRNEPPLLVHFRDVYPTFRLHEFRAVAAALFPELNASAISFVDPAAASSLASKSVRTSSDNFASPSTDTTTNSTTDTATDTAVSSRASMVYGGGWQRVLGPRRKTTAPDEGPEVPPVLLWLKGLSGEEASAVAARCVLVRALYEVWGDGDTHEEAAAAAAAIASTSNEIKANYDPVEAVRQGTWCARVRRGGGRKHHSGRVRTNMISSDNTEGGGEADENGEEATDGASSSIKKKKGKGEFDVTRAELRKTLAVFGATLERLGRVSLQAADHHIYVVEDRTSEVAGGEKGGGPLRRVYFGRELIHHHLKQQQGKEEEEEQLPQESRSLSPPTLSSTSSSSLSTSTSTTTTTSSTSSCSSHASRETAFNSRVVSEYSVKQRRFIGPTSMDAEMSFVMANAAGVKEGSAVLDPFCGTGGILLAAAALGANPLTSLGCDIDPLVLTGRISARPEEAAKQRGDRKRMRKLIALQQVLVAGVSARDLAAEFKDFDSLMNGSSIRSAVVDDSAYDKNKDEEVEEEEVEDSNETSLLIEQNFEDRGLKPPHFMCADAATLPDAALPLLREAAVTAGSGVGGEEEEEGLEVGRFDAIVTDPPYGKREWLGETKQHQVGNEDQGDIDSSGSSSKCDTEEDEFGQEFQSTLSERIDGLLQLADRCLKPNGSLVFFLPVASDFGATDYLHHDDDDVTQSSDDVEGRELLAEAKLLALLPAHPALKVVAVGRDPVGGAMHRLLITMRRRSNFVDIDGDPAGGFGASTEAKSSVSTLATMDAEAREAQTQEDGSPECGRERKPWYY